jgi:hypothetical protein
VDLTVAGGRSSPELGLDTAPGHGGLPRRHGRQEGGAGTLVAGSPRAEGRRGGGNAQCARNMRSPPTYLKLSQLHNHGSAMLACITPFQNMRPPPLY